MNPLLLPRLGMRSRLALLPLPAAVLFGQVATDGDLPNILDDGTSSATAYYQLGVTADYAFSLSQTGESYFIVGNDHPRNSLSVNNGADADFEGGSITLGASADSTHNGFYVTGTGSTVSNAGNLNLGGSSSTHNQVGLSNGASWHSSGVVYVGAGTGTASNTFSVASGATFTNDASRDFYAGYRGSSNFLSVSSGAQVTLSRYLEIGYYGSLTSIHVSGADSLLAVGSRIQFGRGGGENNTLGIYNGGTLTNGNDVTFYGSNNGMIIDGDGSMATLTGLDLGYNGSTGNQITVQAGGLLALTQSDVAIEAGNVLRLNDGYIAWLGDRTADFNSFISGSAIEFYDSVEGWTTATTDDLTLQYFAGDDAAALAYSGYSNLGNYTILGTTSAVPEPSTYAAIFGLATLGLGVLRRHVISHSSTTQT